MVRFIRTLLCFTTFISAATDAADLRLQLDEAQGTISVFRDGLDKPLVTQNARPDFRPYLHPIHAPDGNGVLTEYSPDHHKHQTGLYWGFTRVNGRDYFHHPEGEYWRRVALEVTEAKGHQVSWKTVYDLLDEAGQPVLRETQTWSMHAPHADDKYTLELVWEGQAKTDITIGKYDYGGLFLRMPWKDGIEGEVITGARAKNQRAEGKRATWVDVGMEIDGRDDWGHIAILDHAKNKGYPQPWRVDGQLGIGPVRARLGDWSIKAGDTETIRHAVVVQTGELNDQELTDQFLKYAGVGGTWALWGIAQREGREAKFLSAQDQVEAATMPDGFEINAYANEPMITQPMAFCWDDRGRMWVAENRDYENRREGFSNFGDSRILILEDTDHDGVADSRKVFLEGIPFPSAIAVGFDGLWLGAPPNLLFVPDRNHDDVADMDDIEVRLTGWGIRDRHETLNSFHWGPDGWLYGLQGYATPSRVGKPSGDGKIYQHNDPFPEDLEFEGEPEFLDGGVWRYHPTKDRFEVVAHGFSNPWGIDYDRKGQLFISACVIPHLWHVIPGGTYHRQGGKHINPYYYSDIRTIADHRHRSAHGGARIYLSDAFPPKYHDRIFMCNIHEHAVLTDVLEPRGSGFIGRHGDEFMMANNAQWIGFSMEIGPEGAVYALDWHDADICGNDVVHKDTGRIYRMTSTEVQPQDWPGRYDDLAKMPDEQLAQLQTSSSAWHARRARVILQHRSGSRDIDAAAMNALRQVYRHKNADYRLRGLWALHCVGQLPWTSDSDDHPNLLATMQDGDPHIRAWAIQLACEDGPIQQPSDDVFASLLRLAEQESSPVVRMYLASALQRIGSADRVWSLAEILMQRQQDIDDHNIPKLIWFGIEPHVVDHVDRALTAASESQIPQLTQFIARRLTDGNQLEQLVALIGQSNSDTQVLLLGGMRDALQGRIDLQPPENWEVVYQQLIRVTPEDSPIVEIATELAQQFGDTQAVQTMLATLSDQTGDTASRKQAMRSLAFQQRKELVPKLKNLLADPTVRREAIQAMAAYEDSGLSELLLQKYNQFTVDEKLDAVQTLAARRQSARALTAAIKQGNIPKRDIPAYVARQMRRVVGNSFTDVWGPIETLTNEKRVQFQKMRELLTVDAIKSANQSRGRTIFRKTCYACHKLYGEGGSVGPEITGANRSNLEYILGNVLTPSAEIQDAYKMTIILTDEARIYSGIVVGETDRHVSLRVAGQDEPVLVPKVSIESREIAPVSMMPDGLLDNLQPEEILDLVAYLQSTQQVPEAK